MIAPIFASPYIHDISPFVLHISGEFGIRWYGLAYLAGFVAAYFIISFMSKRGISPMQQNLVWDFVFTVALGTIIGGRLGYCVFYSPELFTHFSSSLPFWGVLAINQGGMASHGGMIGVAGACYFFAKKHSLPLKHLFDLTILGGTVGIFFGRIANFINGELVGRPSSEGFRWAVKFPQDILGWDLGKVQNLYDAAVAIGINRNDWSAKVMNAARDRSSYDWVQHALITMIAKIQEGNAVVREALAPYLTARHPSQLYEAFGEGLFLFIIAALIWRKAQKPGVITGWMLTLYSIVRVIGEQFRMPDPQIGFQIFGATRGQLLSIGLFMVAITFLVSSYRSKEPKLGGWGM